MRTLLLTLPILFWSAAAPGVLIDSGDGTGNTGAPPDDPGWEHVGLRGGLTAVYLGSGAVLTANHVGAGDLWLGGTLYPFVADSDVRLDNGDGTFADLLLFAVYPEPPLPDLAIAATPPPLGTPLVMIGNGRNRGEATSWDPGGPGPPGEKHGYFWAPGRTLRWGTNFVEDYPAVRVLGTEAFASVFDLGGSDHEAQAASGDSGGATFAWNGSEYELAGLMYAISVFEGQPEEASLEGQLTYSVDLSFYREQIETWIAMPEPAGGLWPGLALLACLAGRARARRPGRR